MAPTAQSAQVLLSPAELSYLHSSLALTPPVRPDGRTSTELRSLVAEADILPTANGSARICFQDGTEAIAGVKAEVENSQWHPVTGGYETNLETGGTDVEMSQDADEDEEAKRTRRSKGRGENTWVEMSIEIPGFRDDDALPVYLAAMLTEALLSDGVLKDRLYINNRYHWKLYIDILLLSPPLSYPLPLLSLTTHLALLSSRLPSLKSEGDEDPFFDDDWEAATPLYAPSSRPPVTLLVMTVGSNIIFDPAKEELAVAEAALAVSCASDYNKTPDSNGRGINILSIRTIDPPSRLTPLGIPNSLNSATGGAAPVSQQDLVTIREGMDSQGVWRPPRGGIKRSMIARVVKAAIQPGGVADEILQALKNVER
ncbi:exoribonuclease family protein [Pseudovirgaria hyperparasitica]|uniref:Ribosomal RNA-processing protein 42 n=1 Tax=Pseudovirgaria hyperparasitica TaxID=470096 RepID=A0A6A6WJN4_9PEZI|nr:exoribonuclease family protein [Pseudovirgaria hyperparasitica]KAF2762047.1 exoribonuclease family protein [Pseudovirgaria hyperparasitica]